MLEAKIDILTAAILALTAAMQGGKPAQAAPQQPAKDKTPPAAPSGAALDYEKDVKPLALRVAKEKNREALVAILGTFKVAQANLLKPEQFGPFITACNAALTPA